MLITLLHSKEVEQSRTLLAMLGTDVPDENDVTVSVGNDEVRVISKHVLACQVCPNFAMYPAVMIGEGDKVAVLNGPETWSQIMEWIATKPLEQTSSSVQVVPRFSRLDFMSLFTFGELEACEEAAKTNAAVAVIWRLIGSAEYIDISDQRTKDMVNNLVSNGLLTAERAADILAGKSPSS